MLCSDRLLAMIALVRQELPTKNDGPPTTVSEAQSTVAWQGLVDGLWVMGWPSSYIEGAR